MSEEKPKHEEAPINDIMKVRQLLALSLLMSGERAEVCVTALTTLTISALVDVFSFSDEYILETIRKTLVTYRTEKEKVDKAQAKLGQVNLSEINELERMFHSEDGKVH